MSYTMHKPHLKKGMKIDLLTLIDINRIEKHSKHYYYYWNCKCDCGNSCVISETTLEKSSHIHSCGCYPKANLIPGDKERVSKAGKARAAKRNKDGCNVDMLFRNKPISTNTSGVQGVSWSKTANKWHVYVGYQNKRANLGFIEDFDLAIKLRQAGLQAVKDGTFEEFYLSVRGKPYK